MTERDKTRRTLLPQLAALAVCVALGLGLWHRDWARTRIPNAAEATGPAADLVAAYAADRGLTLADWPQALIDLLERDPDTEEFVLAYPTEHGKKHAVDLSDFDRSQGVPLFLQWDERWGYLDYGGGVAGVTGCGPVALSMAAYYLTGDPAMSPDNIIRFALDHGYCVPGNGSSWKLISQGGPQLGLTVEELPLDQGRVERALEAGCPVICVMGPGDFTTSGHFIVLAGLEDGLLRVNDPNSIARSERLWAFEDIQDQIENLWALSLP